MIRKLSKIANVRRDNETREHPVPQKTTVYRRTPRIPSMDPAFNMKLSLFERPIWGNGTLARTHYTLIFPYTRARP